MNANLNKPFSLEAHKAGVQFCTRNGYEARVICTDLQDDLQPIAIAIKLSNEESIVDKVSTEGVYSKVNRKTLLDVFEVEGESN